MNWKKVLTFPFTVVVFILAEIGAFLSYRIWWSGESEFFGTRNAPPKNVSAVIGLINVVLIIGAFIWAKLSGIIK